MGFIYCATSPSLRRYIGQTTKTVEERWKKHVQKALRNDGKAECRLLNNAIRKYGAESFTLEIVFEVHNDELNELEQLSIGIYGTHYSQGGYNMTYGGESRITNQTEESKDKMSETVRVFTTYDLPRNVVEIHDAGNSNEGFRVITKEKTYNFVSMHMTMDEKYVKAIECYQTIQRGELYVQKNLHKRGDDELVIPLYVVRAGLHGFAVHKPGFPRKTFKHINNTREENLENAKEYLKTLK